MLFEHARPELITWSGFAAELNGEAARRSAVKFLKRKSFILSVTRRDPFVGMSRWYKAAFVKRTTSFF